MLVFFGHPVIHDMSILRARARHCFRVPWCVSVCCCACCLCSVCKKDQCAITFRVPWWVVRDPLRLLCSTVVPFPACCGVSPGCLAPIAALTCASATFRPQLLLPGRALLAAGWTMQATCGYEEQFGQVCKRCGTCMACQAAQIMHVAGICNAAQRLYTLPLHLHAN